MNLPHASAAQANMGLINWPPEYRALRETAGIFDLSTRSRICLIGNDRVRFLHGQITNDIKKLGIGEGCYAAIVTAKGKMESDVNVFNLQDELLLDFEPGLASKIIARLEKFIVADDVQIVDATPHYGLLSVQGPKAADVVKSLGLFSEIPDKPLASMKISEANFGEIYLVNNPRLLIPGRSRGNEAQINEKSETPDVVSYNYQTGFDVFVPINSLSTLNEQLLAAAKKNGGYAAGETAFETARIEAGVPRFGVDMDETNIPLECGIENRAVSYKKGCYIGQEVINRIHSIGHVNKELRGLRLADDLKTLPVRGDKLFRDGKEAGYVTSAVKSPTLNANIALGYVRREAFQIGNKLMVRTQAGESAAVIMELPFVK